MLPLTLPTAHAQPNSSNPEIHINLSILKLLTTGSHTTSDEDATRV